MILVFEILKFRRIHQAEEYSFYDRTLQRRKTTPAPFIKAGLLGYAHVVRVLTWLCAVYARYTGYPKAVGCPLYSHTFLVQFRNDFPLTEIVWEREFIIYRAQLHRNFQRIFCNVKIPFERNLYGIVFDEYNFSVISLRRPTLLRKANYFGTIGDVSPNGSVEPRKIHSEANIRWF